MEEANKTYFNYNSVSGEVKDTGRDNSGIALFIIDRLT